MPGWTRRLLLIRAQKRALPTSRIGSLKWIPDYGLSDAQWDADI